MIVDVTIRAFEMTDWEDVAAIWLAPSCQWYTLQMPYQSRDAIQKKLENPPPGLHRLVAVVNNEQKVVGLIGIHALSGRRAHVGEMGMCVRDDYQDRGIGYKLMEAAIAFAHNWLNLKRLELIVYTDNVRAIRLYEKFGFAIEGTLRKYALRDGIFADTYTMAKIVD